MATMLVGLFGNPSDHKKVMSDLEAAGFQKNEFIVFLVQHNDDHTFMVTSKISEPKQIDRATEVYNDHHAQKLYNFVNMSWEAATYESFREEIRERAKLEIREIPNIYVRNISLGIDSRVRS